MDSAALLQDLHFQVSNTGSARVAEVSEDTVPASDILLDVEDRFVMTGKWVAQVHSRRQRSLSSDSYFGSVSVCDKLKKSFLKPFKVTEKDLEDLRLRLDRIKINDTELNYDLKREDNCETTELQSYNFEEGTNFLSVSNKPGTLRFRSQTAPLYSLAHSSDSEGNVNISSYHDGNKHGTCNLGSLQSDHLIKDNLFDENHNQILHACVPEDRSKSHINAEKFCLDSFRNESIFPSPIELKQARSQLKLSPNKILGSYENGEEYLKTQFYLMREDFIRPLRQGIADYQKQFLKGMVPTEVKNLKLHRNVLVIEPRFKEEKLGIVIDMGFPLSEKIGDKDFMDGSLVLITPNNFKDILVGTVISRRFISRVPNPRRNSQRKTTRRKSNILMVQLHAASHFDQTLNHCRVLLAEPQAFFQPYYNVMKIFQDMSDADLPLKECIISSISNKATSLPPYIKSDTEYVLEGKFKVNITDDTTWPCAEVLNVNDSQMEALKKALSQKLVLIQGPPGTGKTYLGCKVAKALLQNRKVWNKEGNQPMLLMCQTNHALDQFMELLLPVSKKLIRIGCQSKSDLLAPYNIREWLRKSRFNSNRQPLIMKHKIELKKLAINIQACHVELMKISSHGIVDFQTLVSLDAMDLKYSKCFHNSESFLMWLEEAKGCKVSHKLEETESCSMKPHSSNYHCHSPSWSFLRKSSGSNRTSNYFANPSLQQKNIMNGCNDIKNIQIKYILSLQDLELAIREQKNNEMQHDKPSGIQSSNGRVLELMKERLKFFQTHIFEKNEFDSQSFPDSCLWSVHPCIRWVLYRSWVKKLEIVIQSHLKLWEKHYMESSFAYADLKLQGKLGVLRQAELVGMTTSAAARLYPVLRELHCPIALVEEASEVHEPHIVATVTRHCRHLILLGDHKQLRPRPACYSLSQTHFTDISLFERLVLNNTAAVYTLLTQHRMQPEISALIRPSIYSELYDHECTKNRSSILGMKKNVYFLSHHWQECKNLQTGSYSNPQEAKMAVQLLRYLLRENYAASEICILTAYREQINEIERNFEVYPELIGVRVLTVDNFQGEESRIVILSLVRNNDKNQIGFLKIENRVCVALSRARDGLFILGNIVLLSRNSGLWLSVETALKNNDSVGWSLPLSCRQHPLKRLAVRHAEELSQYIHSGGCEQVCSFRLACGHSCRRTCHVDDPLHLERRCEESCMKTCSLGHKCKKKCAEECGNCESMVWKQLSCGHLALCKCCLDSSNYLCKTTVKKRMEPCLHRVNAQCWMPLVSHKYCPHKCPTLLKCGHQCPMRCNSLKHPNHNEMRCFKCQDILHQCNSNHSLSKQ